MATLSDKDVRRIAGIEVNALALAGVLTEEEFSGGEVGARSTPIHDINGEVLYHRVPILRRKRPVATVDIAVHEVLGDPLLAVSTGLDWNPDAIVGEAREHARRRDIDLGKTDEVRFVAYSHPKIAVQFLSRGRELAMLEIFTWEPVPPAEGRKARPEGKEGRTRKDEARRPLEPGNFERWSLIEETPDDQRRTRAEGYRERLVELQRLEVQLDVTLISPHRWSQILVLSLVETREIAYSLRSGDHVPCYELRGQETNVWCVGASAQMLLDFYRYEYTQTRLAQELGLGTPTNPNGLPYSQVAHVVTALETLTGNGLDLTMITSPTFSTFHDEILQNRPLISFVPGHSRTVAGYTRNLIAPIHQAPYEGLLVYDPWPPNAGVITRWENFATQTYQFAYTAKVAKI